MSVSSQSEASIGDRKAGGTRRHCPQMTHGSNVNILSSDRSSMIHNNLEITLFFMIMILIVNIYGVIIDSRL